MSEDVARAGSFPLYARGGRVTGHVLCVCRGMAVGSARALRMIETQGDGVAIIGGGSIGVAFALVFAQAGFRARVQDPDRARRRAVRNHGPEHA